MDTVNVPQVIPAQNDATTLSSGQSLANGGPNVSTSVQIDNSGALAAVPDGACNGSSILVFQQKSTGNISNAAPTNVPVLVSLDSCELCTVSNEACKSVICNPCFPFSELLYPLCVRKLAASAIASGNAELYKRDRQSKPKRAAVQEALDEPSDKRHRDFPHEFRAAISATGGSRCFASEMSLQCEIGTI